MHLPTVVLHPTLPPFSRLIWGAMRLDAGEDNSPAGVARRLDACVEAGLTSIDHADIYGRHGHEALFGQALRLRPGLRQRLQLISKCGICPAEPGVAQRRVKHYDSSAAHIRASLLASLHKLGVDRLELLLIHRPDPLMDADETAAALDALVDEGLVAGLGVSNFRPPDWQLLQSRLRHPLLTNQIEASLAARAPFVDGQLAFLQQQRVHPMAWSPLGGGATVLRPDTPLGARLHALAAQQGVAAEAVALAWLLRHPAGLLPVVGTQRIERIARLGEALRVELDRQTWFELWTLAEGHELA